MAIFEGLRHLTSQGERYVLFQRFQMPTAHGSRDAIAVTAEFSRILLSLYTLMISVIVLHIWYLFVLFGIAFAYTNKRVKHNHGVANVAIWNSQTSPLSIITAMYEYRSHIPVYASFWALAAFLAWAGSFAISLLISPYLIVGTAAPVNQSSIYIPSIPSGSQNLSQLVRWQALQTPQYLRAIDALQSMNPETGGSADTSSFNVHIKNETSDTTVWNKTQPMYLSTYSYNITGVEFGLQHLAHLLLEVRGSCQTKYDRYIGYDPSYQNDMYTIFNQSYNASSRDSKQPSTTIFLDPSINTSSPKSAFEFLPSTMNRLSFTEGLDPWYQTNTLPPLIGNANATNIVKPRRPVLSCWEESLMSYKGSTKQPISDIHMLGVLPPGLVEVFQNALGAPVIVRLTQSLGSSALKSALTAQGIFFDAQSASIHSDLTRLVQGAYVATKRTLAESTMFDRNLYPEMQNLAQAEKSQEYKDGVADFVIYGNDFAALSVKLLIIIPALTIFLFIFVNLLTDNPCIPFPWAKVNALKAPVLYSALDNDTFKVDSSGKWKRRSKTPHYAEKDEIALVRPKYERGTYSWVSSDLGSLMQIPLYQPEPGESHELTPVQSFETESMQPHGPQPIRPYQHTKSHAPNRSFEPHRFSDHESMQSFEFNQYPESPRSYDPIWH